MATIRWSTHKDDEKVGQVEDVEDNAAARYVATGMARYADPDPEPEPEAKVNVDVAAPADQSDDATGTAGDVTPQGDPAAVETQSGQPAAATDPDGGTSTEALDPLAHVVDAPNDDSTAAPTGDGESETAAPKPGRRSPSAKQR